MLTVVMTSIPAARISSTSWARFSCRLPGTLVWASSSTQTTFGRRAITASVSISVNVLPLWLSTLRGTTSSPSSWASVLARPCVST